MHASLGSPTRSQAAVYRLSRSTPTSPLPLSSAPRTLANASPISTSGCIISTSTSSGANALPQTPDSPATPSARGAATASPARHIQLHPLPDGAAELFQPLLSPLPPLAEEPQDATTAATGLLNPLPLLAGGPPPAAVADNLFGLIPFAAGAGAGAGAGALGFPAMPFPADPDAVQLAGELAVIAALPLPPPPALLPQLRVQNPHHQQPQAVGDHQLQQFQALLQQVHEQMQAMQAQVQQAQALQQEMAEMQQEAQEALQQGAQGVLEQAVQQAVQQVVQAVQAVPQALQQAVLAAEQGAAVPVEPAAAPAAVAPAPVAPAEVPMAQAQPRDPERDVEPGVWLIEAEVPPMAEGDGAAEAAEAANGEADDKTASDETELKMSKPAMVFLRSLNSSKRTRMLFANESARPVTAFWLNYSGQEIAYGALLPGQAKIYETYVSHPWVFRDSLSGERMMVGGRMAAYAEEAPAAPPDGGLGLGLLGRRDTRPQPKRVAIHEAPPLKHSRETHAAFPAYFKAASQALLLAHQRLQRPDLQAAADAAAAAAAAAADARRTLAEVMCRMFRNAIYSVILAAQPAVHAALGVCGPTADDSPNSDNASRLRWLDGAALGGEFDSSNDVRLHDSGGDGPSAAASRPRASTSGGRLVAVWRSVSVQLALTPAAPSAATAAAAAQIHAPLEVQMRVNSFSSAAGDAATVRCEAEVSDEGQQQQRGQLRGAAGSSCNLPACSETRRKSRAEAEADESATQLGELFAELPRELVAHIIHLMAPAVKQHVALHPRGHPDILPALLPSDPATWAPRPEEPPQPAAA